MGLGREDIEITHPEEVENVIGDYNPDVLINSVAFQAIDKCEIHPKEAFDINSIAVSHIAKMCEKNDITLLQLSTHSVFDGTKDDYYTEDDCPNPVNTYGASKYIGECFARSLCMKHYVIRLPTMFGGRRAGYLGFVDKLLKWIAEGKELRMADDKIDSFGYTVDTANSLITMTEEALPFGVYHLTNSGKGSYYDLALKIVEILGSDNKVNRVKDKDFKAIGNKPLKTAIRSVKLKSLRSWEDALYAYITKKIKM